MSAFAIQTESTACPYLCPYLCPYEASRCDNQQPPSHTGLPSETISIQQGLGELCNMFSDTATIPQHHHSHMSQSSSGLQ